MAMLQLNPTIDVLTPNGEGEAIIVIDPHVNCNTIWIVRHDGGKILHYYSDDVRIFDNPANGKGWNVEPFETVKKIPKGAKRNMDFLKNRNDKAGV